MMIICSIDHYFKWGFSLILTLLISVIFFSPAFADEARETLIIRSDLLPTKTLGKYTVIPARDPFSWPIEQLQRFEDSNGNNKNDPFAGFTLNGIIWTENEPVAVINNQQLRRGESINGVRVRDIDKNSVIIANRRTSRTLRFPDPFIELGNDNADGNN